MTNHPSHAEGNILHTMKSSETSVGSDAEIANLLCEGDLGAFTVLYDRYAAPAYALALRLLHDQGQAEDVVQEILLSLWERPDHFHPCRGSLRTWVLSATHHRAIDRIRRRASHPQASLDAASHLAFDADEGASLLDVLVSSDEVDPAVSAEQNERAAAVRHALTLLPPAQRKALLLAYFSGLTHQQIAVELGEPLGTVKTRIRLALMKLRALLAQFDEGPARTSALPPATSVT